ncbi:MAG: penicillin acylase family protein [Gemmataceae bacterium]
MQLSDMDILGRLGAGETIAALCEAAGCTEADFRAGWQAQAQRRLPATTGQVKAPVRQPVRIDRDRRGVPHIVATNDTDLFVAFGYVMAQDRLFQLDYLRRRGAGRLAEILGGDGHELDLMARVVGFQNILELDILARTVGIRRLAEAEWQRLDTETKTILTAFTQGINAWMEQCRDCLPIEFDLLGYRPEPWTEIDCLTIEGEFRWYLTGRFPVIVMPELAKRALGEGPLLRAFLVGEADAESILPPGSYPRRSDGPAVGTTTSAGHDGTGSNNWVVNGAHSASGKPLLASDPHVYFDAVSLWYEVHLCGGSFQVAGMAYAGMPAVMFGRNERVAWGCTNNICSQRDLYLEQTDPAHPDCFLFDGQWEPARRHEEIIAVKGGEAVRLTIRSSRNGPIVSDILPPAARKLGPVSLKWLGASEGGWLTALLAMDRAASAQEFRAAMRPWYVPTFSVVYADVEGHIGYQASGRIPLRRVGERGFRPGWEPAHQWAGLIPFEEMPHCVDPPRGWLATANNRVAPDDFLHPLSGTWVDGLRAWRIREMIEQRELLDFSDCVAMHQDAVSKRASRCLPYLLRQLAELDEPRVQEAVRHLSAWDGCMERDRVGATLFVSLFSQWTKRVVQERFAGETAALLAGGAASLAASLLEKDDLGWFAPDRREPALRQAVLDALDDLAVRLGPDMTQWTWGRIHVLPLRHVLSGRGDLGQLLDQGGLPVQGDLTTVCNTGLGAQLEARIGGGYRLIVDLSSTPPALWAIDGQSQSGHPASPHYRDQFQDWLEGRYHCLTLDRQIADEQEVERLTLEPRE